MTSNRLCQLESKPNAVVARLSIDEDDFEYAPFSQFGGLGKAYELFGDRLPAMLEELNARLAA